MSLEASSRHEITRLLRDWRSGDEAALDTLTPRVYDELRRRAHRALAGEGRASLAGTELVHEAFLRLVDADVSWQDRAHFLAVAAQAMRRILVDRARARNRLKRGEGRVARDLDEARTPSAEAIEDREDLLALDAALRDLATRDAHKAKVLELSFFGGLTVREIAEVTESSKSAVQREMSFAKAWLHRRLGEGRNP
ncbi:MAG: ECF-type sigma factor [Holophagales bacterium]|nr:ECF-type sigma factor [Holophagales bacterium]